MTKQTTDRKEQERLATGLTRTMLYLKLGSIECIELRQQLTNTSLGFVGRFSKELLSKLQQAEKKMEWFMGTVKKALGPHNSKVLDRDMQLDSERLANLAQLTEWLFDTPGNVSNAIDLVVNSSVRRDLMMRAWRAALGSPELAEQDLMRFNAWYNANFPH